MKSQDPAKGIRPGFLLMGAGALVVLVTVLGWRLLSSKEEPLPPREVAVAPAVVETPTDVTPPRAAVPTVTPIPVVAAAPPAPAAPPTPLELEWGIQVSSIGLGMAGAAVDFRYKVVAPDKASRLSDGKTAAYLVDLVSGARIQMISGPQEADIGVGARAHSRARMARQGGAFPPGPNRLTEGKINSVLLPNPSGLVKSGSKVALVVGDVLTENLIVE